MSNCLILIPARYGSSRFPGKPLAKINDIPMIQYVVNNCRQTGLDYAVVTDSVEIEEFVQSVQAQVVRVDDLVETGSERIALAYKRYFAHKNYQFIINVQGDEPLLISDEIQKIAQFHQENLFDICTAVKRRYIEEDADREKDDFFNVNVVKAIYSELTHQCLYFSRAAIPFNRSNGPYQWFQHIGIYSYKVEALMKFVSLDASILELNESLEQLRALENGMSIGAKVTNINLIGVDTPEDIKKIEGVLSEQES